MTDLTHTDLHRDMGRMEGRLDAMDERLERLEKVLDRIDGRLARIESQESKLRGAWWVLAAIGALVGGVVTAIVGHLGK